MRLFAILFVVHASACLSLAQTKQVLKGISTNALTESLVVPTGKTLTIDAGGTIVNNGTATGFTTGLAIGTSAITGGTSGHVLYNNAGTLGGIDLTAVYQPLNTNLTTIAALANGAGVLTNNGSGTFTYTATSTGGSGSADSGKIAVFNSSGVLRVTSTLGTEAGFVINTSNDATSTMAISSTYLQRTFDPLKSTTIQFATPSGTGFQSRAITIPATTGTLITTGDTGTVTNAMLAGSIALSKLATTGTASASTYLRGDGAWTAIDLSGYLPLAGGTMTGVLTLPAGSVSAAALTFGDADTGLYTSSATASLDFAVAGSRMLQINTTGLRLNNDTQDTIWRRADVGMLIMHGQTSNSTGVGSAGYLPGVNLGSAASLRWTNDTPAASADIILSRVTTSVLGVKGTSATAGASIEWAEMTAPGTPGSDRARLYLEDNGSGKSRLVLKWADGTTTVLATQP